MKRETYAIRVREGIYRDAAGNEIGFERAPIPSEADAS